MYMSFREHERMDGKGLGRVPRTRLVPIPSNNLCFFVSHYDLRKSRYLIKFWGEFVDQPGSVVV